MPLSDFHGDKTPLPLTLYACGEKTLAPQNKYGPAICTNWMLSFCSAGSADFHINESNHAIGAGEGVLLCPRDVAEIKAGTKETWRSLWVTFGGTQAALFLARCGLSASQRIFHPTQPAATEHCLRQLLAHHRLTYPDEFFQQSDLYQLFGLLADAAALPYQQEAGTLRRTLYIQKALAYLQANFSQDLSISQLADYLGLNRSYLTTLFQKELQLSPRDCLIRIRIARAKRLLAQTEQPVSLVAHSCGYPDPLAFTKAFRKLCHISPSAYRLANREGNQPPNRCHK